MASDRHYRILALANGNLVYILLIEALRRAGHTVQVLEVKEHSTLPPIVRIFEDFKPDFCIEQNYYNLAPINELQSSLESYLNEKRIPCVCWFVDSPYFGHFASVMRFSKPPFPTRMFFLCQDRTHLKYWERIGLPVAHFAPAADDQIENRQFETPEYLGGLTYVGRPGDFQGEAQSPEILKTIFVQSTARELLELLVLNKVVEAPRSDYFLKIFDSVFSNFYSTLYSDRMAFEAACESVILALSPSILGARELLQGYYLTRLGSHYSHFQMASYVQDLQSLDIRTFGSPDWKRIIRTEAVNEKFLDRDDLYAVYASSKIHFIYTKWQVPSGYSERPIHTLACRGFPLNDYREDLAENFESHELVLYRSIEEAKDLIRYYSSHESDRLRVIEAGRAKVFAKHTYRHRVEELISHVQREWNI